ncbi:MAG: thioredoxin-like domain-containing protein [Gemmatales bacterium]|nr:thioredoxin-like domain-containing protein [Gemmatales bacterium]MDW8388470.1 thioredoxin-like domain-containing protein [Gemmatales bacterium]
MTASAPSSNQSNSWTWIGLFLAGLGVLGCGYAIYRVGQVHADPTASLTRSTKLVAAMDDNDERKQKAPELDGGLEWLNCGGPIRLKDLRGKIVLLDFWTYCCINCIHVLPDLARLEKKYANQLVVIGVHSAKFDGEKDSKNIREAILRYHIEHPVVNDANHRIWEAYDVHSWPTLVLIDPEGYYLGSVSGEGHYDLLDRIIERLIKEHREKKTLNEEPIRFDLDKYRERRTSPLAFPGKVFADPANNRIFIADSSHHRIVITDLNGKLLEVAGRGEPGYEDGPFDKAMFNDPQGMALQGETLLVADRKNHRIRAIDLKAKKVSTIAGTGEQGRDRRFGGDALKTGMNSPWDILLVGDDLYIAQAGHHQLWKLSFKDNRLTPWAGNGRENIFPSVSHGKEGLKGTWERSMFAQPSGLATDGKWVYVADSEVSAVRAVSLDPADRTVKTLVGEGLFEFGDVDGFGEEARLQHCLGVAWHNGKVYVADTYNNKIKVIDPETLECRTFLGDGKAGRSDDPPRFDEPAGLHVAGDLLFVADTNNHRICIVDLKTKAMRTLNIIGLQPPQPAVDEKPVFVNATKTQLGETVVPRTGEITLTLRVSPPPGFKLNTQAPFHYMVKGEKGFEQFGPLADSGPEMRIRLPAEKVADSATLTVSLAYYVCKEGSEGICQPRSHVWEMTIKPGEDRRGATLILSTEK